MPKIIEVEALKTTFIKTKPEQSRDLANHEKIKFPKGIVLPALAYTDPNEWEDEQLKGHIKITFSTESLFNTDDTTAESVLKTNLNTFYLYPPHIGIGGLNEENEPADEGVTVIDSNKTKQSPFDFEFNLPGKNGVFNMRHPIVNKGRIYWYEILHFNKNTKEYRRPENIYVVNNLIKLGTHFRDDIRPYLKRKFKADIIVVNSGYRDPITNKRVGGASRSRHCAGDALDFVLLNKERRRISPYRVNRELKKMWGKRGGLASASVFTHIDARGYYARWSYGY